MKFNPTIATDAYKITHWLQRPENMTRFYNYGEPRKGGQHDAIIFFGLQYILKEYFMNKVTQKDIDRGMIRCKRTFGIDSYFPKEIWEKVKDLGYFPLRIKAVKAGILTGVLLAVARISGETAPLLFTALNNQFINTDMNINKE